MGSHPGLEPPGLALGPLKPGERAAAVSVLARAFRDNPLNRAVIDDLRPEGRERANAHGMRSLLPVAQRHGVVLAARTGGRVAGVLIGMPPFVYPLPAPPLGSRLRCLLGQGWQVARRWSDVFEFLDARHPAEPHAYLGTLGVEPALQGRGVGSALVRSWLEDREARGCGAYLETDAFENVAFYARFGFEVVAESKILETPVWHMNRPPLK